MKRLCFASIFNVLVLSSKDSINQTKIFNSICEATTGKQIYNYDEGTISKIKKGNRSFPLDYKKMVSVNEYEIIKKGVKKNIIPLLKSSLLEKTIFTIKDIILSDSSFSDSVLLIPSHKGSTKEELPYVDDLPSLLASTLYYSIVNVKNSVYTEIGTEKIESLISADEFALKYPDLKAKRKQDPNNHGIVDTYVNVDDILYKQMIESSENIDIIHIHGMTWTNRVRKYLTERLKDEKTTIRVVLLSPDSDFFEPYAYFIGKTKPYLIDKLDEILTVWERMYCEATNNRTQRGGKLVVYLGHFFPSKSIYRFDNKIIVNPSSMTQEKTPYLPTVCCTALDDSKESFFSIYLKEFEWIANKSVSIDAANNVITRENFCK